MEEGVPPTTDPPPAAAAPDAAAPAAAPAAEQPESEPEPEPDAPAPAPAPASPWQPLPALTGERVAQCEELEALAQKLLADWDSYKRLEVDPKEAKKILKAYEKNPSEKPAPLPQSHDARVASLDSTDEKGKPVQLPVTLVRFNADGLTPAHLDSFFANIDINMPKMMGATDDKPPMMVLTQLGEVDDGALLRWVRVKPPKPMSPRSSVTATYRKILPDGSQMHVTSTKATEEILAREVAEGRIKAKDVRAKTHLDYNLFTPYDGGVTMLKVSCMDLGGNIPGAVKKKIAEKQLAGHWPMVEFMLTGKVPEPF
jgi:hypothetical protein